MIGIVGLGYVGSAVYSSIKSKGDVLIYDVKDDIKTHSLTELKNNCKVIFVCVPTPSKDSGEIDDSIVLNLLEELKNYAKNNLVILKSTILPDRIPHIKGLVYNPEFLNERTHIEDFKNQNYMVLGGNIQDTSKAQIIYEDYFELGEVKYEHCSIEEASFLKYFNNIYGAYKILFWEFVHDVTGDSRKISQMMRNLPDPRMDIVGLDGQRGFGGACFPKDVKAFNHNFEHILTKFMLEYNSKISSI